MSCDRKVTLGEKPAYKEEEHESEIRKDESKR